MTNIANDLHITEKEKVRIKSFLNGEDFDAFMRSKGLNLNARGFIFAILYDALYEVQEAYA